MKFNRSETFFFLENTNFWEPLFRVPNFDYPSLTGIVKKKLFFRYEFLRALFFQPNVTFLELKILQTIRASK